jgi:SpoIID/LytB domain protein
VLRRLSARPARGESTVRVSFGGWRFRFRSATLVPMAGVMLRRVGSMLAALAVALATAGPARASTLFTVVGHGWGHGIGMSQYGTLGYALHGYSYTQILHHYFTGTRLAPVSTGVTERVLLASGRTSVDISAAAPVTVRDEGAGTSVSLPAGSYRVRFGSTPGRLQVVDRHTGAEVAKGLLGPVAMIPTSQPLELDVPAGIGFTGDHWHGWLRVVAQGHTLDCIDVVPMEHYVQGVLPNEMPSTWPTPALRAQAVATRSYAYATRRPSSEFDAYSDTRSQVYGPIEREAESSTAAVQATYHDVVWYGSTIATTFFSSSSGGRTSSEQAAWGTSSGQPYLVPVSDPFDKAEGRNPNHTWVLAPRTPAGLAALFGYSSPVASIDQVIDPASLRERTLTLHTLAGDRVWSGPSVQAQLGLRSVYFRVLQVTLSAPHRAVRAGTTISLTGRVWPRPSTAVTLMRRTGTSTVWTVGLARVPLDAEGRFALRLRPTADKTYRLVVRNGAVSPRVHVTVTP